MSYARGQRGMNEIEAKRFEDIARRAMELEQTKKQIEQMCRNNKPLALRDVADFVFDVLDDDESGEITRHEIMDFVEKVAEWEYAPLPTLMNTHLLILPLRSIDEPQGYEDERYYIRILCIRS